MIFSSRKNSLILLLKYFTFYIGITIILKEVFCLESKTSSAKAIIESSNSPNLSVVSFTSQDLKHSKDEQETEQEQNSTWISKGFSETNISALLANYSTSFFLPSPSTTAAHSSTTFSLKPNNSSRLFLSLNESSGLTITIKQFKHGLMYLNFSYYIGNIPEVKVNESKSTTTAPPESSTSKLTTTVKPSVFPKVTTPHSVLSTLLKSSHVSTSTETSFKVASLTETSEESAKKNKSNSAEQIIIHDLARKKRSLLVSGSPVTSVEHEEVPETTTELEVDDVTPSSFIAASLPTNSASSNGSRNSSSSDKSKSLSLGEAVEMIKRAAAAISKGAKKRGGDDDEDIELKLEDVTNSPLIITERKDKPDSKHVSGETGDKPKHRHKSTTVAPSSSSTTSKPSKSEGKGKRGRHSGRKHGKVDENGERIGGKRNDNEKGKEGNKHSSSSSSSSEEAAEEVTERGKVKEKIPYKTWKASFEKKNRPPGLYVMVNDDIIFDNWEGFWNKHHVLGRWSGTNSKHLPEGVWNHTQIFLNFEDVQTTDVKITFEWEPVNATSYVVLGDITVSTVRTRSQPSSCEPEVTSTSSESPEKTSKPNVEAIPKEASHVSSPVIIIKQGSDGKGVWQIIKMGKAGSAEVENVKELNPKNMDSETQTKLMGEDASESLVKAVLKTLQDGNEISRSSEAPQTSSETPINSASISNNKVSPSVSLAPQVTPSTPVAAKPSVVASTTSSTTSSTTEPPTSPIKDVPAATPTSTFPPTYHGNNNVGRNKLKAILDESNAKKERQRNEDNESALLVSVVTGSIAMAIIVLSIKKYVTLRTKTSQQNQSRE